MSVSETGGQQTPTPKVVHRYVMIKQASKQACLMPLELTKGQSTSESSTVQYRMIQQVLEDAGRPILSTAKLLTISKGM